MDEADALDALANLLTEIEEKPYDHALHSKHIRLSAGCGEPQVQAAREMLTNFLAAVDKVWLPMIEARENAEDSMSLPGIQDIVSLYERAEADYLCA
jgi:hypothetical protein